MTFLGDDLAATALDKLAAALANAQAEMKNPAFDSANPHFRSKFASLAAVRNAVLPCLNRHGLSVIQVIESKDGGVGCGAILLHASGQRLDIPSFVVPMKGNGPQDACSASTYARRYQLQAMAGVVGDEDDDGEAASGRGARKAPVKEDVAEIVESATLPSDAPKPPGTAQIPSSPTASYNAISKAASLEELDRIWKGLVPIKGSFAPADWQSLKKRAGDRGAELKREKGERELNEALGPMVGGPDGKPVDISKVPTVADLHNRLDKSKQT